MCRIRVLEEGQACNASTTSKLNNDFALELINVLEDVTRHDDSRLPDAQALLPVTEDDLLQELNVPV